MADEAKKLEVTEDELRQLRRWAVVAFAARCARRVQPLFTKYWPQAPDGHVKAVEAAIAVAESSARAGRAAESTAAAAHAATLAADAARSIYTATYAAAHAAAYAADAARTADADAYPTRTAARAAAAGATFARASVRNAARADFEELKRLSTLNQWDDTTPVDVDRIGPLWWGDEPDWWPEESLALSDNPPTLQLEFSIPHGVPKEEADKLISEIIQRANEVHHSMGGTGLTITDAEVYESEPAMVPVGDGDDDGREG